MDIRFVSTLTSEDEERVAGALLAALVALLEDLPITYALRIETAGQKVFQQTNMPNSGASAASASGSTVEAVAKAAPFACGPSVTTVS